MTVAVAEKLELLQDEEACDAFAKEQAAALLEDKLAKIDAVLEEAHAAAQAGRASAAMAWEPA